ncbi:MAG: hypothetical protein KatS3mg077_3026 [Candidatus Binatia bacterium]|nr:MAG: hypothetical protein KatS3mg077_3026 [Candidatus Binatia bacterium]
MRPFFSLLAAIMLFCGLPPKRAQAVCGPCKAEQVTTANANAFLFGGTDAAGGVGDWYLTNGKIVAIIDNIDTETIPTVGGTATVDLTSSNAVQTGGTLIDLGLKGKHNDQFPQGFNTGGFSLANVFLFRKGDEVPWGLPAGNNPCATVEGSNSLCPTDTDCAAITVYGIMLGTCTSGTDLCSTRSNPKLRVRTTYKACNNQRTLFVTTEVWNQTGNPQSLPIFDVFLWGGRGLMPFAPDKGRGFTHPVLNLSSTSAVLAALTSAPFFAVPGNVDQKDGLAARNKKAGAIAYGYFADEGTDDSNGPASGGTQTTVAGQFEMVSLQGGFLSAATLPTLIGPSLANNASRIFKRRIIVGDRNDPASVIGDQRNPESILLATPLSSLLGTVSGRLSPASPVEGTITFVRVGGPSFAGLGSQWALLNTAPISAVRTKSSFKKILLPEGDYVAHVVVPGQADFYTPQFTVTAGQNTAIPPIAITKPGKLKVEVRDANTNTGIPAKISLSPSPDMKREFASFVFDTRNGMCSNNLSQACTNDSDCGAGNTCFRTCTNKVPVRCSPGCPSGFVCASDGRCRRHDCNADTDCDPGFICRADTSEGEAGVPGTQPGGGQVNVIYTDAKGKATVDVKPGTYTVTISRGPEYTITQVPSVTVSSNATTNLGIQTIKRVVDTTGYMSADFHIHSARSLDSSAPLEARVRSFAGEGLEVMVSTDHDINTDYAPVIKKLKMQPFIASIVGTEVTTSVPNPPFLANAWGHINSWPSIYDPNLRRAGSVEDESVSANVIYDRLRAQSNFQCVGGGKNGQACSTNGQCPGGACLDVGEQVIQLNHPRAGLGGVVNIGMFDNIGFNPPGAVDTCQLYPVRCASNSCAGGTNDGTSCTTDAQCTGGGRCGCNSGSIPGAANGCNRILLDRNVVPQASLCTTTGCGSGFENPNGTRNIDFDVMEIDNGGNRSGFADLKLVRRDWLSLLNQGIQVGKVGSRHFVWGTGVSDSHRLVIELPGYSRTYVGAGDFPPPGSAVDIKGFNNAVLAGNMSISSGPYVSFTADAGGPTATMGQTLGPNVSSVNLHVQVQAAPWVPVEEVRIIKNGCVIQCFNTTTTPSVAPNPSNPFEQTNANVVRFNATITDTVSSDSYYIVEASQNLPLTGAPPVDPIMNLVAKDALPWAMSNPIFVDGDGDNTYSGISLAPGTGEPTCPALPPSCSAGAATAGVFPPAIMVAQQAEPPARSWFVRLVNRFIGRAQADDDGAPRVMDDSERVRQREEELRKGEGEHIPWNRIAFPTPEPTPAPPQQ